MTQLRRFPFAHAGADPLLYLRRLQPQIPAGYPVALFGQPSKGHTIEIDGSCHYGDIPYKAEVNRDNVIICHFTDCQVLSGGAFRMAVPAVEGRYVRVVVGVPERYFKTEESGKLAHHKSDVRKIFVGDCPGLPTMPFLST